MRRFALGCLNYTPERFAKSLIGDTVDALIGYREAEGQRYKSEAELIRRATWHLWYLHASEDTRMEATELWPLPWDEKRAPAPVVAKEIVEEVQNIHDSILSKL